MPFVLSLSKHRPSSARRKKEQPFDKLRANGVQGFFVASWLCASPKNPPSLRPSIPRQNPVHQLLHRRGEVVRIKGIGFEVERGMAREHQILLDVAAMRSEEHTSELQSLMRNSYAVFCLKKKKMNKIKRNYTAYTY